MSDVEEDGRSEGAGQKEERTLLGEHLSDSALLDVSIEEAEHIRNSVASRLFGAAADPMKIAHFTVLKRLGTGGMGVVYSAYDDRLDRKVAIKLLRSTGDDEDHRARLRREAQALARLSHPNVIQVYEVGTFRSRVFVAMEFVDGETLGAYKPDPKRPLEDLLDKFRQAGEGLAAAHQAGLVHRDFKPENVLVGKDGRVRVLDFGLAGALQGEEGEGQEGERIREVIEDELKKVGISSSSADSFERSLTNTGAVMGTPAYMSPEQHLGLPAGRPSDQFSFCVALWEKLYGERPFAGKRLPQLAAHVVAGKIRELPSESKTGIEVPRWLERVLRRGLSSEPDQRYPDIESLLLALSRDRRVLRRMLWTGGFVIAVGTSAFFAGYGQQPESTCEGGEERLAGVWDSKLRQEAKDAFLATGLPYAKTSFESTAGFLDDYAARWVKTYRRVCEGTVRDEGEDPGHTAEKMACLERKLAELREFSNVLRSADREMIDRASDLRGEMDLILPEACAEEELYASRDDWKEEDIRLRTEIESENAKVRGHLMLGRLDEGLEVAKGALEAATKLGDARTLGRTQLMLGRVYFRRRDNDEAQQTLRQALRSADEAGDDMTRLRTWNILILAARMKGDFEAIDELAEDAKAVIKRLGSAPMLEAEFFWGLGNAAMMQGKYDRCVELSERGLTIYEKHLGAETMEAGALFNNLASCYSFQGHFLKAREAAERAMKVFESRLGDTHPKVASTHTTLGSTYFEEGRSFEKSDSAKSKQSYEKAVFHYRKAIDIREIDEKKNSFKLGVSLSNLAETQRRLGQLEESLGNFERALAKKREKVKEGHLTLAYELTGIGRVQRERGKLEQALAALEQAWKIRERLAKDVPAESLGETLFALAQTLSQRGGKDNVKRAQELAERALEEFQKAGDSYRGEAAAVEAWLKQNEESRRR